MKAILIAALLMAGPALTLAEAKPAPNKTSTSSRASKPAAKSAAGTHKGGSSTKVAKKKAANANRVNLRTSAAQLAAGVRAADRALTPEELALADKVQTGRIQCELGNVITLAADPKAPGHFDLELQNTRFRMAPVETSTGAIRLEDAQTGAVWLQLANKSMLMNQKLGQRLADDCQSPAQTLVAEGMKRTPPPGLFDSAPAGSIESAAPLANNKR